jgi:hypothetical protein
MKAHIDLRLFYVTSEGSLKPQNSNSCSEQLVQIVSYFLHNLSVL